MGIAEGIPALVARAGIEPATFRFSGGRSYQLSYLAGRPRLENFQPCLAVMATLTGLEPATSAVTGRRANRLRHWALLSCLSCLSCSRATSLAVPSYLVVPSCSSCSCPQRDSNPRYRLERATS